MHLFPKCLPFRQGSQALCHRPFRDMFRQSQYLTLVGNSDLDHYGSLEESGPRDKSGKTQHEGIGNSVLENILNLLFWNPQSPDFEPPPQKNFRFIGDWGPLAGALRCNLTCETHTRTSPYVFKSSGGHNLRGTTPVGLLVFSPFKTIKLGRAAPCSCRRVQPPQLPESVAVKAIVFRGS